MNGLQTARDFPAGTAVPNRSGILFPAVGNPAPSRRESDSRPSAQNSRCS
ncbi:hypothetical protein HMPREF9141_0854 [Prevotella multiformis DSM 16608]|uniref:Uncharacterized protein n=1 Tax=Prevotella multiformis DSM 16608 TaxID=888743 RepID=F0F5I8_9BACT|nr:hypothetical protein HMPREF9141_0854 [Prevotella multiformis DSM 16608]